MSPPRLGLRENLPQFSLLVLLNAFVGGMVGLERTVLPLLGEQEFGLTSKTAITSFIVSFGITKAIINLVAARLSDRIGRKPILVVGWLLALPVPFLIIMATAAAEPALYSDYLLQRHRSHRRDSGSARCQSQSAGRRIDRRI